MDKKIIQCCQGIRVKAIQLSWNILIASLIFLLNISAVSAQELSADPSIYIISSGPSLRRDEYDYRSGSRFRVLITLEEIYFDIYIEKISFQIEESRPKVIKQFKFDESNLRGNHEPLTNIENIRWLGYDSLQFRSNSTVFVIRNLDGNYEVLRIDN